MKPITFYIKTTSATPESITFPMKGVAKHIQYAAAFNAGTGHGYCVVRRSNVTLNVASEADPSTYGDVILIAKGAPDDSNLFLFNVDLAMGLNELLYFFYINTVGPAPTEIYHFMTFWMDEAAELRKPLSPNLESSLGTLPPPSRRNRR